MKKIFLLLSFLASLLYTPVAQTANTACAELIAGHNNPQEQRINILIYDFGYSEQSAFKNALTHFVKQGFLNVEPTASNKNLFNFWYLHRDELITRNTLEQIKEDAHKNCPQLTASAKTFEVMYVSKTQQQGMPPGAATFGEGATIALIEPKREGGYSDSLLAHHSYLLLHELVGHAIGELVDEYNLNSEKSEEHNALVSNGINCFVGTYEQCLTESPWADLMGQDCGDPNTIDCPASDPDKYKEVGCYAGCRLLSSGAFRPHDTSIMNEKRTDFFGLVQAREICTKIQQYTGKATGYCFAQLGIGIEDPNYLSPATAQEDADVIQNRPVQPNLDETLITSKQQEQTIIPNIIKIVGAVFLVLILAGGVITGIWYLMKLYSKK